MRLAVGSLLVSFLATCSVVGIGFSVPTRACCTSPGVSLSAQVSTRSLNYGAAEPDTTTIILADRIDGSLPVEIVIANTTGTRVDIGRNGRRWLDFVSARIVMDPDGRPEDMGAVALRLLSPIDPGTLVVESGHPQRFRAALSLTASTSMKPGLYEVHVAIDTDALTPVASRSGSSLSVTSRLRIKAPNTPDEMVDMLLQRSYQSAVEARPVESRQWAERALAINPESIPAVLDIGTAWLSSGNCAQAVSQYDKAIRLLQTGADPRLRVDLSHREEEVTALRGQLTARCASLRP